jgi:hypothetical protein
MSLTRFEAPNWREQFALVLGDECRDYLAQQAGVDTARVIDEEPRVDFAAIWRDLGAAGCHRPAHEEGCSCLRCQAWAKGAASR